jgi:LCP family protein required for cell wall assembly
VTVSRPTRTLIVVAVLALIGGVVALLTIPESPPPLAATSPVRAAAPRPEASSSAPELTVDLGRVEGHGPEGTAKASTLRGPAQTIRTTLTALYEDAFVDPAAWAAGRFPTLDRFFAADARPQVHRDLGQLSLGPLSRQLEGVDPGAAKLDVSFVTDRAGHPEVAFADMTFRGTGEAGNVRVPLSQRGRYVLRRDGGTWRIDSWDATANIPSSASVQAKLREATFAPAPPGKGPLFVLVIGSDARPWQPVTATRGDSLHIVSVNPRLKRGAIVGIPRDSYVSIPGRGTNKINAALFYGGPDLVVRTVEQLTHIHIDAYLLTGFDGFHHLMDGIGGVDLRVPYAMSDANSGAHFRPGRTHLNGREALSFSRDRHDVPGGDLGRSLNQGRVLLATLQRLRQELAKDPARLVPWIVGAMRFMRTDLTVPQMTQLLLAASTFDPDRVRSVVAYGSGAMVNGQSIVRLGSKAYGIFRDVAHDGVLGH